MITPEKPEWVLRSLLVAVPSSVLSCLVTLWLVNPSSSAPPPLQPEVDTEQIVHQLDELRQQIDVGFRAAEPVQLAPTAERQPISEGASFAEEMNGILDRLERLLSVVPSGGAGSRVPDQQRYSPTKVNVLEALGRLTERDPEAAKRSTLLLTPTEVIARFGFPNNVGSGGNNTVFFEYSRPVPGGMDSFAHFNFKDGLMIYYGIDLPDR